MQRSTSSDQDPDQDRDWKRKRSRSQSRSASESEKEEEANSTTDDESELQKDILEFEKMKKALKIKQRKIREKKEKEKEKAHLAAAKKKPRTEEEHQQKGEKEKPKVKSEVVIIPPSQPSTSESTSDRKPKNQHELKPFSKKTANWICNFIDTKYRDVVAFERDYCDRKEHMNCCEPRRAAPCKFYNEWTYCDRPTCHMGKNDEVIYQHVCQACQHLLNLNLFHKAKCDRCPSRRILREIKRTYDIEEKEDE